MSIRPPMLAYQENGLYIVLYNQDTPGQWHWTLYLHLGHLKGVIMHAVKDKEGRWQYDKRPSDTVAISQNVAYSLKIAVIEPVLQAALINRTAQVPIQDTRRFGALTCRTWVLSALNKLDNEGHIKLKPGTAVEQIEAEAKDNALHMGTISTVTVESSIHSVS